MQSLVSKIPQFQETLSQLARALDIRGPYALWESSQQQSRRGSQLIREAARYAYLSISPSSAFAVLRGALLEYAHERFAKVRDLSEDEDPFTVLAEQYPFLLQNRCEDSSARNLESPFPFPGGLLGFVSYDAGRYFERVSGATGHTLQPDLFFLETSQLIVHDRESQTLTLISSEHRNGEADQTAHDSLLDEINAACSSLRQAPGRIPLSTAIEFEEDFSKAEFVARVERALEYIRAGDIFQVVLANRFSISQSADPFRAYDILKSLNPSPYHFAMRFFEHTIVGASPEVMLQGGPAGDGDGTLTVKMRLVAGTYPKGTGLEADRQAENLGADAKELAEHLMLVDHARNDLGRVSQIGSVEVADLFSIETYADVHHLVSQVSGRLKPDETLLSALRSCFPIATLTGTPKIRAMEIIAELETRTRGIFGGAIVALGRDRTIDSAVAIRALVTGPDGTSVQAGAGIVYDSNPEREYAECRWKAEAIFAAISGSLE